MKPRTIYAALIALTAIATFGITALLMNIFQRKQEAQQHLRARWSTDRGDDRPGRVGQELPAPVRRLQAHRRHGSAPSTAARGVSAAGPGPEAAPHLRRLRFRVDYREERGHAYMLADQDETERRARSRSPAPASTATPRSSPPTARPATATS